MKDRALGFCLPDQNSKTVCLDEFKGKWVVLYFYPKDNSKGCTLEAINFTESLKDFEELDAVVIGVSPDSVKRHQNFVKKHDLKVLLLSDEEHEVLEKYGAWQVKKMYGREFYGVVRSTFIINPDGYIEHAWRKVRVKGHVEEVKQKLSQLEK